MFMPRPKRQPYVLYGVAMLGVVTLLGTVCILAFQQVFTKTVPVTMHIQRAGLQLLKGSDVKMRGLVVGDVASIDSNGDGAVIKLRLNPKYVSEIPDNVHARLIPKTVFGEKYVDLVTPDNPSVRPLKAGDVIGEDVTTPALEIDQALNDLLPLLRTVRPQDLNSTLSAMAQALSGRGDQLGQTTVTLEHYLQQLNPHMPQIQHDFQVLAKVAGTYDQAAPALLRLLQNATFTGDTLTAKQAVFRQFLQQLTGTADVTHDFLAQDANSIVQVNLASQGTLALLAQYSPEYYCLFQGTANLLPRIKASKDTKHTASVRVEFHGPKPAYVYPIDAVQLNDYRGPTCYGLPNPPLQLPTIQFRDGTEDDPRFASRNGSTAPEPLNLSNTLPPSNPNAPGANPASPLTGGLSKALSPSSTAVPGTPSMGSAGTATERAWMNPLLAAILGEPASKVPGIADMLWGAMARGTEVNLG